MEVPGRTFFADEKFTVVIEQLESLGWVRGAEKESADLTWTNLKSIDWFGIPPLQTVNHLRGSQHMSNKAFLAYHMETSGFENDMPSQWSSAYQDLAHLVGMVTLNEIYALCIKHLDSEHVELKEGEIGVLKSVVNVLSIDEEWAASMESQLLKQLIPLLIAVDAADSADEIARNSLRVALQATAEIHPKFRYAGSENIWIIKPVGLSCGANIKIVQGLQSLLQVVRDEMSYKCVVQKYIERPLLVRSARHKFDIRQWILVTSVSPLLIFGFSEFYCRLSSAEYSTETKSLLDPTIHLTNHSIQKMAASFETTFNSNTCDEDGLSLENPYCKTMMTQAQFEEDLQQMASRGQIPAGIDNTLGRSGGSIVETFLLPQIKEIAIHSVACVRDKLDRVGSGFEWLGLDLMITSDLKVLLIECNVSPDISLSTPVTARLVSAAAREIFPVVLNTDFPHHSSTAKLTWQKWYPPEITTSTASAEDFLTSTSTSTLMFARSKRDKSILGKDHVPRKLNVAERVFQILNCGKESIAKEVEDSDEL